MPVVRVLLIKGYAEEVRRRLGQAVTDAVRLVIDAPKDAIIVATEEVLPENYMRGGETRRPGAAVVEPVSVVKDFLEALEARDLDAARRHLSPQAEMVFPSGVVFKDLDGLVVWGRERYRKISKTIEGFDVSAGEGGPVVTCRGTLQGVWPDGSDFSDIRFIDRFELGNDGLIRRQEVWNDLAERKTAL